MLRGGEIDTRLGAQNVQWFSAEWDVGVHVIGLRASRLERGEGVVVRHEVDAVLREHCTRSSFSRVSVSGSYYFLGQFSAQTKKSRSV